MYTALKFHILFILLLISSSVMGQGILVIEFDPYDDYFVNLDGTAYYTARSSVIMYGIEEGKHRLIITPKNNQSARLEYILSTKGEKDYFVLQKRFTGLKIYNKYAPSEDLIKDIMVQADSIYSNTSDENTVADCQDFDNSQFSKIASLYVSAGNKTKFIEKVLQGHCITINQFNKLIDLSLTTEEKYILFTSLYPDISQKPNPSEFKYIFDRTEYYKDFLKYIKKYDQ